MRPRTLLLRPDRRLERLCDDVIHLRDAYRRNPDPKALGDVARTIGMPPSVFANELRRLRHDPGPDHWRGLMIDGTDLDYTPFAIHIRHVGDITIETGCPLPGDAHWDWALLDMETGALPRLALH